MVVRGGVEPPTFRFQVNSAKRYADLQKRTSPTSETALGGRCDIHASSGRYAPRMATSPHGLPSLGGEASDDVGLAALGSRSGQAAPGLAVDDARVQVTWTRCRWLIVPNMGFPPRRSS